MKVFSDIRQADWLKSPMAVNLKSGVLYVNPEEWNKLSDNSRKFVIAHELGHLNADTFDEQEADEWALWYRMQLGESSISALKEFYSAMPFENDDQVKRGENLLAKVFEQEFSNPVIQAFNGYHIDDLTDTDIQNMSDVRGKFWSSVLKVSSAIGSAVAGVLTATGVGAGLGAVIAGAAAAQSLAANSIDNKIAQQIGEADSNSQIALAYDLSLKQAEEADKIAQENAEANKILLAQQQQEQQQTKTNEYETKQNKEKKIVIGIVISIAVITTILILK